MSIEKIRVDSQEELEQMITKEIDQIEKNLTVICSNIPINDKATLEILCHDSNGQLVILQSNVNEDDVMLLHGIQSLDYVDKFKGFLKATYNKHKINDAERPRLILIAPSFSDALRRVVDSIKGIRIDLYEWEYLKLGDHKGLRLQPIFTWKPDEKQREEEREKQVEKKREAKPAKKKEPETEKNEEFKPELPQPEPEPPEEELPKFPPPSEEKSIEEEPFRPEKQEPPKRKLKLF